MTPLPHIHPALHIGDDDDAFRLIRTVRDRTGPWVRRPSEGWAIVHAAKTPWHAGLLGYNSGPAPQGHPEQYFADRDRETFLNLVDSPSQLSNLVIPILDHAVEFIDQHIDQHIGPSYSILVHCNMGLSRSPAVVLWWMHRKVPSQSFNDAMMGLTQDHPYVREDTGIMKLVKENWVVPN